MKFNFFLLLLTILTAVALSQEIPTGRVQLQASAEANYLFWASSGTKVILEPRDVAEWTIEPYEDSYLISPFGIPGSYVQYNGHYKQLTITNITSNDFPPQVLWSIRRIPTVPVTHTICSRQGPPAGCTIAEKGLFGFRWKVIAIPPDDSADRKRLWTIIKVI
jgi:hypothetical protein